MKKAKRDHKTRDAVVEEVKIDSESKSDEKPTNKKKIVNNPSILFVGQLTYDTRQEDIVSYFKNSGVEGNIDVRLLTDAKTKQSRGMAFLTLDSPKSIFQGLALHHTRLNGRIINVERSCGGRNKQSRTEKLKSLRSEQKSVISTTVNRIIQEYIAKGSIFREDIDEKMKISLNRLGGKLCVQVLEYFSTHMPAKLVTTRRALLWNQIEAIWHNQSLNSTIMAGRVDFDDSDIVKDAKVEGGKRKTEEMTDDDVQGRKKSRLDDVAHETAVKGPKVSRASKTGVDHP